MWAVRPVSVQSESPSNGARKQRGRIFERTEREHDRCQTRKVHWKFEVRERYAPKCRRADTTAFALPFDCESPLQKPSATGSFLAGGPAKIVPGGVFGRQIRSRKARGYAVERPLPSAQIHSRNVLTCASATVSTGPAYRVKAPSPLVLPTRSSPKVNSW